MLLHGCTMKHNMSGPQSCPEASWRPHAATVREMRRVRIFLREWNSGTPSQAVLQCQRPRGVLDEWGWRCGAEGGAGGGAHA